MSGMDFVLDTNVVIGYLGGRDWAVSAIQQKQATGATFAISQITRMELLGFPELTSDARLSALGAPHFPVDNPQRPVP